MATLYLVGTPIGNLGDLSLRARETLGSVSRVLAEDTRRTRVLLGHLGLSKPLVSFHAHNEASREQTVLDWLGEGEDIALVSDAGTPLVSDPGGRLVAAVLAAGHAVVPIPGPSAILVALVASGLPAGRFSFLGFLPRKGRRRQEDIRRVATAVETTILFESPERLVRLLEDLAVASGPGRRASVGRELTKRHEEFVRGTLGELIERFSATPARGEVTLVVEGIPEAEETGSPDLAAAEALTETLLDEGISRSRAARELVERLGIPRNRAYEIVQESARKRPYGEGSPP